MRINRKHYLRLLIVLILCQATSFANARNITISVRDTRISIDVKKMPLKDVFLLIEQKTGLSIGYNTSNVNAGQIISYKADGAMLSTVLGQLLNDYEGAIKQVDDKHIFLKVEKKKPAAAIVQAVISGKVTDENNQPLPGVSVYEKTSKKN